MEIRGFASLQPGIVEETVLERDAHAEENEVLISITHCAVARGDVDFVDRNFFESQVIVPGYQAVGTVAECGANVSTISIGDRVGVGYQVDSCGICEWCQCGNEHYCAKQKTLVVDTPGGFATHIRANKRFVTPIPDNLSSSTTAPLFCSGLTAYSGILSSETLAGMKVAVIGLGGIGNFASQLMRAHDAEITVVTSKPQTKKSLDECGAKSAIKIGEFINNSPTQQFDRVILTTPTVIEFEPLLKALKPNGRMVTLASPTKAVRFPIFELNDHAGRSVTGSYIGSQSELAELLQLAADGKIRSDVDVRPFSDANKVLDEVRNNKSSKRIVLEANAN
jgi:D-arabinose 1-dehydrogenase-like Zn-dependent alcohol dehydrogenase